MFGNRIKFLQAHTVACQCIYNTSHEICTFLCFALLHYSISPNRSIWLCTHVPQGYFTGTGAIIWLPQCQWSNPEEYGKTQPVLHHNKAQILWNILNENKWCKFDNFVVTDVTLCHNDNLWCHQSCQINNILFLALYKLSFLPMMTDKLIFISGSDLSCTQVKLHY